MAAPLAALFSELTVLGFIGLVMFSTTKLGKQRLDKFVCDPSFGLFAHDEEACLSLKGLNTSQIKVPPDFVEQGWICIENPLIELTEDAHMSLFLIMMIFLVVVVLNIRIGRKKLDFWRKCEDECVIHSIEEIAEAEKNAANKARLSIWSNCPFACRCIPHKIIRMCKPCLCKAHLVDEHQHRIRMLKFAAARTAFIVERNEISHTEDHKLDSHFDFTIYMSQQMSEKLTEIVELSVGNWIFIWLIFMAFVAGTFAMRNVDVSNRVETEKKLPLYLFCGALVLIYISYLVILYIHHRIDHIEDVLVHPGHLRAGHPLRNNWEEEIAHTTVSETGQSVSSNEDTLIARAGKLNAWKRSPGRRGEIRRRSSLQVPKHNLTDMLESPVHLAQRRHSLNNLGDTVQASLFDKKEILKLNQREIMCQRAGLSNALPVSEKVFPRFKFDSKGNRLPMPPRDCCGSAPSHQEYLFGGMKNGNHFIYQYVTSIMLMLALYLGIMIVNFSKPLIEWSGSLPRALVLFALALFPVVSHIVELSFLLPKLLLITSTQEFASGELTARTTHIMRSRKALRILSYACAISDASRLALNVRKKALRGATLSKLTSAEQAALENEVRVKTFGMGEVCVEQGKDNDFLHVIMSGTAVVLVNGKQVAELHPPQEFGLLSLLNDTTCTATVKAKGTLVCYLLNRSLYDKYFAKNAKLAMVVANSEKSMEEAVLQSEGGHKSDNSEDIKVAQQNDLLDRKHSKHWDKVLLASKKGGSKNDLEAPLLASNDTKPANADKAIGETKHKITLSSVVHAAQAAQTLSKVIQRHKIEDEMKKKGQAPQSFADRVRKGGRKAEAIEAYRRAALVDLFCQIDSDGSGFIDEEEMLEFLTSVFAPASGDGLSEHELRQVELMVAVSKNNAFSRVLSQILICCLLHD